MHSQNAPVTAEELRLRLRESLHKRGVSQSELVKRLSAASGEEWLVAHVSKTADRSAWEPWPVGASAVQRPYDPHAADGAYGFQLSPVIAL